jgi:hypothetical protein
LLSAILASRTDTVVICGKRTIEGNPRTPSRLLLACDDATLARRVQRYCEDDADVKNDDALMNDTAGDSRPTAVGLTPGGATCRSDRPAC